MMELMIGGAYQGKLDYAREKFSLKNEDIYTCTEEGGIDFSAKCVYHLEEYTLWCVRNQVDAIEVFETHAAQWPQSVFICSDIFCGVVPLSAEMRAWREATGRLCLYLSHRAQHVTRLFCGLAQVLK